VAVAEIPDKVVRLLLPRRFAYRMPASLMGQLEKRWPRAPIGHVNAPLGRT
jgi:hypothetical protein